MSQKRRLKPALQTKVRATKPAWNGPIAELPALLADRLLDDIHLAAQDAREPALKLTQSLEMIETSRGKTLPKAHRQIDIPR